MTTERNFTSIGRATGNSGQNIQHFMTNSPWSAQSVLVKVRQEIAQVPEFATGGMLLLDESADEKSSSKSAGAGRQHNGRLGKIEMSQVGTFLSYVNDGVWTWVDGELFLPEHWFDSSMASERKRLGVPEDREFKTKIELGWQMIERVSKEGLAFEAVGCDTLYGRSVWLRRKIGGAGLIYMADIPVDTLVYEDRPVVGVPKPEPGQRGPVKKKAQVLSDHKPQEVRAIAQRADTRWRCIRVRDTERGELCDEFSVTSVWTTSDGGEPIQENLVMRRDAEGKCHFALCNAPLNTPIERLAWMKCQRHFAECANQNAKSEAGWDELRGQKFMSWEHHLAMTILATWFVGKTKHQWAKKYARSPQLLREFEVDVLPRLSMGNIRELLRAVMPLPQLRVEEATGLVVEHLVNRTRSRKSRLSHIKSPP